MGKIRAVIFDMDGVLIDAKDWHYEALNKALGLFGYEISRYDHLVTYDGLPTRKKLEMLSVERGLPRRLHPFINELKQQYTMDFIYEKCKPFFCHEYALSRLKNEGYHIAVASNSVANTIQLMMEKAALIDYLEFYLSNEDVKNAKPNPEIYDTAIKKLRLKPQQCMVVEDNKNGIEAAVKAGANVMRVNNVTEVNYENIKKNIVLFEEKMQ